MTEQRPDARGRRDGGPTTILILDRLAANPDPAQLLAAHPELTLDDVKAALTHARDALVHRSPPEAAREKRFRRMLAVAAHDEVDGDALLEELEREDAERRAGTRD